MTSIATAMDVEKAYLAYFGRPADIAGMNYWLGKSISDMDAGFAASQEYATLYGGMTNSQRVDQVYQNLFGRAADPAGKAYWVGQLNAGLVTIGTLVATMEADALGVDIGTINNRLTFAIDFTVNLTPAQNAGYNGTAAANAARVAMSEVTYTDTSLATAKGNVAFDISAIDQGESPVTLAAANAAAVAAAATNASNLAAYGSINGMTQTSAANTHALVSGANTVNMVVGSAAVTDTFDVTANPTAVTINISGNATGALTLAKTGSQTSSTALTVNDSTAAALTVGPLNGGHLTSAVFNNTGTGTLSAGITVGSILQSVSITGTGTENFSDITSAYAGFTLTDSSSAAVGIVSLTASATGADSISNSGSGLLTIGTATLLAGNNTLTISSSGTGGITDTADTNTAGTVTFTNSGGGTITETDMVANSASTFNLVNGVTGTISDSSSSAVTVNGTGDNSNLTLNITGSGGNTISLGSGADTIVTGSGSDSITLATGANNVSITGGAGADTITLGAAHTGIDTIIYNGNNQGGAALTITAGGTLAAGDTVANFVLAKDVVDVSGVTAQVHTAAAGTLLNSWNFATDNVFIDTATNLGGVAPTVTNVSTLIGTVTTAAATNTGFVAIQTNAASNVWDIFQVVSASGTHAGTALSTTDTISLVGTITTTGALTTANFHA